VPVIIFTRDTNSTVSGLLFTVTTKISHGANEVAETSPFIPKKSTAKSTNTSDFRNVFLNIRFIDIEIK
jgi:hypothetical protein